MTTSGVRKFCILFTLSGNTIYRKRRKKNPEKVHSGCCWKENKINLDRWMSSVVIKSELSATGVFVSARTVQRRLTEVDLKVKR